MKRKSGEGSITWSEIEQRFIVAVSIPDRRIYRRTKTEAEAVKLLQDLRRKYGLIKYSANMGLAEWYEEWLFEVKAQSLAPRSIASHKGVLDKHIRPYSISKMAIAEITKMDVTKFFNQLAKDGRSRQTIEKVKARLSTCFNEADDYIEKNPVKGVNVPKAFDNSRKYGMDEDIEIVTYNVFEKAEQKLLTDALGEKWVTDFLIFFILGTGLRIGEALAITRMDYDGKSVMVRKSLQRVPVYVDHEIDHYDLLMSDVKTKESVRRVQLPLKVKKGVDKRFKEIRAMKIPYQDQGLLFPDEMGSPMDDKRPLRRLKALEKRLGLPNVNVHGLRHSYATRLLEAGEPIHSISKLLGHSTVEMTQDVYAHVMEDMKEKTVSRLDAIL